MSRRFTSAVLIVVLTLQAVVFAPAAFASSVDAHSITLSGQCPDHPSQGKQRCPCCPDGSVMPAGCTSLGSAFATGCAVALPVIQPCQSDAIPFIAPASVSWTYAPLNPPPIR
jgi:hypothetical protein